jgi:vitamin-K-epoxide reductase (warfarin-sensitive)
LDLIKSSLGGHPLPMTPFEQKFQPYTAGNDIYLSSVASFTMRAALENEGSIRRVERSGEQRTMKHLLAILALIGIVASVLALREHYSTDTSPCSINERWDCGIVNHSPYATLAGIPVAVIGIAGYFLLGVLALRRAYRSLLAAALPGLAFSLYLAHIEAHVLGVWCVYCVASLGVISAISLLALGTTITSLIPKTPATPPRA